MAYDLYTAICHPLLYHITMSRVRRLELVAGCYLGGLVNMVSVTTSITQLSFCQPHVLPHFCDIPLLSALACSDPWVTQILTVGCGGFTLITSIMMETQDPFELVLVCTILDLKTTKLNLRDLTSSSAASPTSFQEEDILIVL
eukprot:bmy_04217T0